MKRIFFGVLTIILMLTSVQANDWPQFLGPDRTGVIKDANFKGSLGDLKEMWSMKVGVGFGGAVTSNGEAFILDRDDDDNDILKCIDIANGKIKWENKYKAPGRFGYPGSRSMPSVDDKHVFTLGSIGDLVCTDRKTGKMVWRKDIKKDYGIAPPPWGFGQSPLLYKDMVIFAPMKNKGVVALKKSNGVTVWESAGMTDGKLGYSSPLLTEFLGQTMIIQQSNEAIVGLNPETGKKIWGWDGYYCKWTIPAPVVVDQNTLFITGAYGAGSVMIQVTKSASGFSVKELFRHKKNGAHIHAPIVYEKHIYGNFNNKENMGKRAEKQGLTCLDLEGNTKWKTGDKPNLSRGSVILVNDYLIALDGDTGELILSKANPNKYQEISRKKVLIGNRKNIWSPICYSAGLLIVRDQHEMKCLKIY
ncbi:MAG: PQQ-like beta-propeller repeat protein [Lentisphaeraceae bacterium]|nr:PQQ-like beta-propeller repeat protein [Lentisphaeraceae bacterium]